MPRRRRNRKSRMPQVKTSRSLLRTSAFRSAVKSCVGKQAETYHHRVQQSATAVNSAGILVETSSVDTPGDSSGEFRGQEISMTALNIRSMVQQADSSNVVRTVLFRPTAKGQQMINDGANFADLFYNPARAIYSSWLPGAIEKVYFDRTLTLNGHGSDDIKLMRINQRLGGLKYKIVEADLGQSTPAGSPVIFLGCVSDSNFSPSPNLEFESILYYKDF